METLEVKIIEEYEKKLDKNPDLIHVIKKGNKYSIYASKEFLEDPLAKLQLGNMAINFIENSKITGYPISEVTFKYKSKEN
ncbi:MAG: hypothetical protein U9Q99_03085 [Nanoarchaeota archaeon]|nr:hypothetical protein [Nanoarchaeota archaeon]